MRLCSFAVVALVLLWARPGSAQEDDLDRARAAFDQGQTLFEQGQYDKAAEQFSAAFDARSMPAFLYNAALSYEKARNYEKAVELYQRYLQEAPKADDRADVEKRIAVFQKEIERQKAAPPPDGTETDPATTQPSAELEALGEASIRGVVIVESTPQGATVYLDDKKADPVGKTPWNGTLEGEHTIYVEAEGYKPDEDTISAARDRLVVLKFKLAEEDYLGWIDIRANVPNASIYIDDKVAIAHRTPWSGNLKPGKHKIWITKEGYDEYATEVNIVPGETHEVSATLTGGEVGYLNVRGRDVEKVRVYVDGNKVCDGPCRHPLDQGTHTVTIKRSGYKPYSRQINVQPKTETTVRPNLAPEPSRADAMWAYAFAAAFAGGGVWLGMQAGDLEDELQADIDSGNPPVDDNDGRFLRGKLFAVGADVAYTISAATLATAIYYTFRDKGQPSTATTDISSIAVTPYVSPDYAGVGMEVRW